MQSPVLAPCSPLAWCEGGSEQLKFNRIAIVGSGALGCYYGARLITGGANVVFQMRSDLEGVRRQGLNVRWPGGGVHLKPVVAFATAEEIGLVDLVIVTLKTTAAESYDALIRPLLGPHTAILTLQNGLGADAALAQLFGAERVMGGLCFICVNRLSPGLVECFQTGSMALAEYKRPISERLQAVDGLFRRGGIKTELGDDLELLRWRKLVWNVPFNGLSIAAGGITTDVILSKPELEAEVRALMNEVVATARALGHRLPPDIVDLNIERTRPMGPYKPSSLIDFLAGREVEVESIWGEPLRAAKHAGVAVPTLESLYARIAKRCGTGRD